MSAMPGPPHTNDLFALFPDLPWTRLRTIGERLAGMRQRVAETRARADANIRRQRAHAERVRGGMSARRRR